MHLKKIPYKRSGPFPMALFFHLLTPQIFCSNSLHFSPFNWNKSHFLHKIPSRAYSLLYFREEFQLKTLFWANGKKPPHRLKNIWPYNSDEYESWTCAFHVHNRFWPSLTSSLHIFRVHVAVARINNCEMWTIPYIRFFVVGPNNLWKFQCSIL